MIWSAKLMVGFSRSKKNADKAPHRGAGALFAASLVLSVVNAYSAHESLSNINTATYAGTTMLLGGLAWSSFLKFGRNFEATMPSPNKIEAADAPKAPRRGRGAGTLATLSSVFAGANVLAIETFNSVNVDTVRNGASALLLGGMAIVSLVNKVRGAEATMPSQPPREVLVAEQQAAQELPSIVEVEQQAGTPAAEFPSITAEYTPERYSPVVVAGAAAIRLDLMFRQNGLRLPASLRQ